MRTAVKSTKKAYRTLLLKKREELLDSVRKEPEALTASIRTPDVDEFATKTAEQDVTAVTASLRSSMLKEIERALGRVASGKYGECEGCGGVIPSNRLKAIPWARYCLICQELRSRH